MKKRKLGGGRGTIRICKDHALPLMWYIFARKRHYVDASESTRRRKVFHENICKAIVRVAGFKGENGRK